MHDEHDMSPHPPKRIKALAKKDGGEWRAVDALLFDNPEPGHPEPRIYVEESDVTEVAMLRTRTKPRHSREDRF